MADINDFGGIKEGFDHISELLDSIRAQNAMKAGDWDKAFLNISSKLEDLSDQENADLIKVFLAEIKRTLDERHNFVSSKFSDIETSFKALEQKSSGGINADEMREIFDIIATNLNVFSKEVVSQKDLLSEITARIEDLKNDESQKKDILRNISVLKVELERFNNGFESIILNLNENFKSVSSAMASLDNKEELQSFKKDIENIFLSSNAVLSALQVIDRKNRELEEVLVNVVTKDEFNLERDQVAKLIAQNLQLSDYILNLADKKGVEDLNSKIDTAVGVINALKSVLNESSAQSQQMLSLQLEKLEETVSSIISEEDFAKFRAELFRLVEEGVQSSNMVRAEMLDTNAELRNLFNFLNSFEIKSSFQEVSASLKSTEDSVKATVWELSSKIAQENEKTKTLITTDINGNLRTVAQKIDLFEEGVKETSKSNLTTILENIQSVINNIFTIKSEAHVDNQETMDTISENVSSLKSDILGSKDAILKGSQSNFEKLTSSVEKISHKLDSNEQTITQAVGSSLSGINSEFESLGQKVEEVKIELAQNTQSNFEGLISSLDGLNSKIDSTQQSLNTEVNTNIHSLVSNFDELGKKVDSAKQTLGQKAQENLDSILSQISVLSQELGETKTSLTNNSEANFSNILMLVDKFSSEISQLKNNLNESSQTSWAEIKSSLDASAKELEAVKGDFASISRESMVGLKSDIQSLFEIFDSAKELTEGKIHSGFEKVYSSFVALSKELESVKEFSSQVVKSNFEDVSKKFIEFSDHFVEVQKEAKSEISLLLSQLQEKIESLPDEVKRVQESYSQAHSSLIEQNSKNIEELGDKIQSLVKSIINKDNPFKESLTMGLSQLKDSLDALQSDFSQISKSNVEDIKSSVLAVDSLIHENKAQFEANLFNVQTKLSDYLEHIKANSDAGIEKIGFTAENVLELKSDLAQIQKDVETLVSDSRFADLAVDLNKKIDGLLLNITQAGEISFSKTQDSLKKGLAVLDEQFANISETLNSHREASKEDFTDGLAGLEEKINLVKEHMNLLNTDFAGVLNSRTSEIVTSFDALKSSISGLKEEVTKEKYADSLKELKELITSFSESVEFDLTPLEDFLKIEFSKTGALAGENKIEILDSQDEIKSSLLKGFDDNMMLVKNGLDELISVKTELIEEISAAKETLQEGALNRGLEMKAEILSEMKELIAEVTKAQDSLSDYKMDLSDLLKVQDDEIREQIKLVEDTIINEISVNIEDFKTLVEQSIKQTEAKLELSEQNYKTAVQSLLSDVKASFYEKVEDGIDDVKAFLEVFDTKLDFSSSLLDIKDSIFLKLEDLSNSFESSVANVDVKDDLQDLSQNLESSVNGLLDSLHDRLVMAMEDNKLTQDVFQKTEEIERRIEDLKRVVSDDVSQRVESFGITIDKQSEDFSNLISELKVSMGELKENYVDLSLNSSMEISSLLSTVQDKIEKIELKLEDYNFESLIEGTKKELIDEFSAIKETILEKVSSIDIEGSISKGIEGINARLDVLALDSSANSSLDEEIADIKNKIDSQSSLLESLKSLEKIDEISKLADGQSEIKSIISALEKKLEEISSTEIETQDEALDVKQELDSVKKEIIENLLSIFDQISFVVEAEEIKDFVEETVLSSQEEIKEAIAKNAQEIKSEIQKLTANANIDSAGEDGEGDIQSSLGNNFDDIISSLDVLTEKAQGSESHLSDIKEEMDGIKKHIQLIQSGTEDDSSDYSYSLQDIESDIAKVRLILDEIAKKKEDVNLDQLSNLEMLTSLDRLNDLEKMNEDIISISTRTNKLLLTSDESYNTLKENLNEFKEIVYNLESKVRQIDNTEFNAKLAAKLENINNLVLSGVKSDKTFNQAFMYLAQWVDDADAKFASISEKLSTVAEVKTSINSIKDAVPDNAEVLSTIDSLSDKFDKQQKRIDKLESKIDQLLDKFSVQPQEDLKSLIEKALSQSGGASAGKVDAKLAKKVDGIDRQLTKLSKGVEKLTSYVE